MAVRFRTLVLAAGGAVIGGALIVGAAALALSRTDWGRDIVRGQIERQIAARLSGKARITMGPLHGDFVTGVAVDWIEVRDDEDSLVFRSGAIAATYDARDLLAQRYVFSELALEKPTLVLRQHADKSWNYQHITRLRSPGTPGTRPLIRATRVRVGQGTVVVTIPWAADPSLAPRARDSITAAQRKAGGVARTSEGLKRSWRWASTSLVGTALAASDPAVAGGSVILQQLSTTESFPPLALSDVRGTVRWFSDSVRIDLSRLRLPHSVARARGVVRWHQDAPPNVDVRVRADTVGFTDLAWVYPTMPGTGGGSADLHVTTNARDPRVMEYALSNLDVRTGGSRVRGAATFGVGGPLLSITKLAIVADPLTTKEIEAFLAAPLPLPMRGAIRGLVRGAGGPMNAFVLDEVEGTYVDQRRPDAPVPVRAHGTLDLSQRGATAYHALVVSLPSLDARVLRLLVPTTPDIHGIVAFSSTLDGGKDAVAMSGMRATFTDQDAHVTGFAGDVDLARDASGVSGYDARLQLDSLDFDVITHVWPQVPLRGALGGPVTIVGTRTSARILGTLDGSAGGLDANLTVQVPPGLTIKGTFGTRALRLELVPGSGATSSLTSQIVPDMRGDSLELFEGTAHAEVDGTKFGDLEIARGRTTLAFGGGRVRVDTLVLESGGVHLEGRGALGLRRGQDDTVRVTLVADSLDQLRAKLRPLVGEARIARDSGAQRLWNDTLSGRLVASGTLTGRLDSLRTDGEGRMVKAQFGAGRADSILGNWSLRLLNRDAVGRTNVRVTRGRWSTQRVDGVSLQVTFGVGTASEFTLDGTAAKGYDRLSAHGMLDHHADTTYLVLDSLMARFGADTVRLTTPSRLTIAPSYIELDTTRAQAGRTGRLLVAGRMTNNGPVRGIARVEDFPVVVQDSATQHPPRATAKINARLDLDGTRTAPRFDLLIDADSVLYLGNAAGAVRVTGEYAKRRLATTIRLDEGADGMLIFAGDIPVDLSLATIGNRLLDTPLVGTLRTDSLRLGFLHRVLPSLTEAGGLLRTDLAVSGRLERPIFEGRVQVDNGVLVSADIGVQLRAVAADIALRHDSVIVTRFRASGERRPDDSVTVSGFAYLPDSGPGALDLHLRANRFAAMRHRSLGSFDINGDVTVTGSRDDALVAGDIELFDGVAYLGTKFVADAEATSRLTSVRVKDTVFVENDDALERAPTLLQRMKRRVTIADLQLRLGDNVRLRSPDANILLGGDITVSGHVDNVSLAGDLTAKRGLYRLDLGLVSRTFQVDSGRVTFQGPLANSPLLDITTTYLVRLENREQVHIRAQITGTVAEPRIVLSSDDPAATGASDTELLSYLIFGVPSFALGSSNSSALNTVRNALAPTLGGVAERALSAVLPGVDMVRVTMASQGDATASSSDLLTSSSITAGQQLGERVFVSVNTGLCKSSSGSGQNDLTPWIGLSLEYRLGPTSWIAASMDPGTAPCTTQSTGIGSVLQFGLDLYREFRFR